MTCDVSIQQTPEMIEKAGGDCLACNWIPDVGCHCPFGGEMPKTWLAAQLWFLWPGQASWRASGPIWACFTLKADII